MTVPQNPWGLSEREYEAALLLTRVGYIKLIAARMGVTVKTIEAHLAAVKHKLSERHLTLAALKFDRWRKRMDKAARAGEHL